MKVLFFCIFSTSLFANNVTYSPNPFSLYRIKSFSELALIESREDLTKADQPPQMSLLPLQIEKTILEFILQHGYIGSVIVVQNGQPIFAKGFGQSRSSRGPVNGSHTTYRWDSITKIFTAVAMMQLSEDGLIDLDAAITTYLTEYANPVLYPGFAGVPVVSVRSLLAMKSGITESPEDINWLSRSPNITDIANYVAVRPRSGVGDWKYVNSGFNICALILGRIVDSSRDASLVFQDFLQDNIFTPSGMTTAFAPAFVAEDTPDAESHIWGQDGRLQTIGTNEFPNYTSQRVGTGNINGSVWDFQKFTAALNSGKLITQANLTILLNEKLGGWVPVNHDINGHSYMDKDGGQTGMRSYYMRFDNNTMIFITDNADPRSLNYSIGRITNLDDRIEYLGVQIGKLLFPNPP